MGVLRVALHRRRLCSSGAPCRVRRGDDLNTAAGRRTRLDDFGATNRQQRRGRCRAATTGFRAMLTRVRLVRDCNRTARCSRWDKLRTRPVPAQAMAKPIFQYAQRLEAGQAWFGRSGRGSRRFRSRRRGSHLSPHPFHNPLIRRRCGGSRRPQTGASRKQTRGGETDGGTSGTQKIGDQSWARVEITCETDGTWWRQMTARERSEVEMAALARHVIPTLRFLEIPCEQGRGG